MLFLNFAGILSLFKCADKIFLYIKAYVEESFSLHLNDLFRYLISFQILKSILLVLENIS